MSAPLSIFFTTIVLNYVFFCAQEMSLWVELAYVEIPHFSSIGMDIEQ